MRGDQTPNDVAAFLGKQNTQFLRMLGVATLLRVAIDLLESLMPTPQLAEDDASKYDQINFLQCAKNEHLVFVCVYDSD